ncbi:hypothetical protein [Williamsia phyllosphaerae]|nr:hypothetical protein [Williamsia phyllosphaerae]
MFDIRADRFVGLVGRPIVAGAVVLWALVLRVVVVAAGPGG